MPNQRAIARAAGVSQSTVSLALQGHRSIPVETRERIQQLAGKMGYQQNAQITCLMQRIRSGKPVLDHSCIAVLVDAADEADWFSRGETYLEQYRGMLLAAKKMGYRLERFFLRSEDTPASSIDKILYHRGIIGVILAAPKRVGGEPLQLTWKHYALAKSGVTWRQPQINSVGSNHALNVHIAFRKMAAQGRRRIGLSLPPESAGPDSAWLSAYLAERYHLPKHRQIPVLVNLKAKENFPQFGAWYLKWKPDALLCLLGDELPWLLSLSVTQETLPLVPLNVLPGCNLPGIEEHSGAIGSAVVGMVASSIMRNELGLPDQQKHLLINGRWDEGTYSINQIASTKEPALI